MVVYNQYSCRGLCLGFRHNKLRCAHRESLGFVIPAVILRRLCQCMSAPQIVAKWQANFAKGALVSLLAAACASIAAANTHAAEINPSSVGIAEPWATKSLVSQPDFSGYLIVRKAELLKIRLVSPVLIG